MFCVLFEVQPRSDQWDAYLGYAKALRPRLEAIDGFVDNIRYASLRRQGWLLSLSNWRDEKALVRWRTLPSHHDVQVNGREQVLRDYHLRVGQITRDTQPRDGCELVEQRLDETEVGDGRAAVLIDARRPSEVAEGLHNASPEVAARLLGLELQAPGLVFWDVYDAVLSPGELIVESVWRDAAAQVFEDRFETTGGRRLRHVRIVRDYTLRDRREAPQFYPPLPDDQPGPGEITGATA
jgi:heme-degrading monooxygenase HmoA